MSVFDMLSRQKERPDGLHWHDDADRLRAHNDVFPLVDLWSGIIEDAEQAGFEVKVGTGYFAMRRSDGSWGSFAAHEGGAKLAREFLGKEAS